MDKFRVGQKVRYKGLIINYANNGKVTEVTEPRHLAISPAGEEVFVYSVGERDEEGLFYGVFEENLEPVYDGDEKSSWNECAWKPDEHRINITLSETSGNESLGYKG